MAASNMSEFSVDVKGERLTKGVEKDERVHNMDNAFIITKRVEQGLKRWMLLQTKIQQKQLKVAKGGRMIHLEFYTKEQDGLVALMRKDIAELQTIFNDEYSNESDRKDERLITTSGIQNENSDSLRSAESKINQLTSQLETLMKSKEDALSSLQSAESDIKRCTSLLEMERKSKEEALSSLRSAESEINHLKSQLEMERKSREETLSRLRSAESEINELTSQLENEKMSTEEVIRLESKNNELTNQPENKRKADEDSLVSCSLLSAKSEIKQLMIQLENERKSREETMFSLQSAESEIIQLKRQLEIERKSREKALYSLRSAESEINQWKRQFENERKSREETLLRLEARINQLTTQVENERKAKEDALLRFSSLAINKPREDNPNIAYLYDPNRPTKLSEQFSELYDNEWTDAFEKLEQLLGDKEEKEIISYLRDFVLEIHSACSDLYYSTLKTIEKSFAKPSVTSEDTNIPTDILKIIKEGIKSMAPKRLEKTREFVLSRLEEKYSQDPVAGCLQHTTVKRYIDRCTEVCWYMSVQDPQLVMDGSKSPDETFNFNKHRLYTMQGPYEDFVVWPALYLHKGGPMLSKGVAQGAKKAMTGQQ